MHSRSGNPEVTDTLEGLFPVAVVRLVAVPGGFGLIDANRKATKLMEAPIEELIGNGFAGGLFDNDSSLLADALIDPDLERTPIVVRWGASPPVRFFGVDLQSDSDGTVIAALHDKTDQYRLDAIACGQGNWVQLFDENGFLRWLSPQTAKALGVDDSVLGTHCSEMTHPADHHILGRAAEEMVANPGAEIVTRYRVGNPRVPDSWWMVRNVLVYLPDDPAIGGFVNVAQLGLGSGDGAATSDGPADMTVAEMMPSGLIISGRGGIQFRNRMAWRMIGATLEAPDPYGWVDVLYTEHRAPVLAALTAAATEAHRSTLTAATADRNKETLWLRIESMPSFDVAGNHVGYAATLLDVTAEHTAREAMQETQELLWRMANHDALTGLPNRMHFHDRLEQALARTRRENRSTVVMFCDLDHFKQVNDEFGHAAGDALLVEIARRFTSSVRETDTVCRLGGDEFVVICEAIDDTADVETLARRLIDTVNRPVQLGEEAATVGLSIGIAVATADSTADRLLALADTAVYDAKQNGRNRFTIATSS